MAARRNGATGGPAGSVGASPGSDQYSEAIDGARVLATREQQVALIGRQIRELRRGKATLTQLAQTSAISIGLLSRLENGVGNPSFASLCAIAAALQVDVYQFFEPPVRAGSITRSADRVKICLPHSRGEVELLVPDAESDLIATVVRLLPGAPGAAWVQHTAGQQFALVLDGEVEFHIEHEVYQLHTGDSIMFDASRPHSRRNLGRTREAICLVVSRRLEFG